MAQAKLGPLVSDIAGSIGGTTLQRSFLGTQLRSRPNPIRRRNAQTLVARQVTQVASRRWKLLTPAQRSDWQLAADDIGWTNRFGDPIRGKGYWLFLRCAHYRGLMGLALRNDPAPMPTFDEITTPACTYAVTPSMVLSWGAPAAIPAGIRWLIFATPRLSAGRSATFGNRRYLGYLASAQTSPKSILDIWHSRFGQYPAAGTQVFLQIIQVETSSGNTSAPIELVATL